MDKQAINVAFVGGGKGCYDILNLLKTYPPAHLDPHVIAVVDSNPDAIGLTYAKRLNVPTSSDYKPLLQNKDLNLIIELTGVDCVLNDILKNKLDSIKVLDHVGALFLWEIIAIQEEKIHLEKKVSDLDTMAAVGEIAFRLTHELRNPLMIIGGLVRRMMTRIDLHHGIRKRLKHISKHVQHAEEVISDICDVVRPLQPHYSLTEMTAFLEEWCKRVKAEARLLGVAVETNIEKDLPAMYIDPSLVRQAFWHIIENSLDAMEKVGGTITIKAILCWDAVHIELTDSGGGFDQLTAAKAFQPFSSSKPGKMGLGLTLCRQIITDHGGDIQIVNEEHTGVTVIVELPISFTDPTAKRTKAAVPA
ncbi:MAG: sensor histidine kinase [Desulfobulbus sp.]|nr:MAG: sensor histidine kinase [Desulfobulbus sp.]